MEETQREIERLRGEVKIYEAGLKLSKSMNEKMSAELEELKAQQAWQPIETAPRDGSRIILHSYLGVGEGYFVTRGEMLVEHYAEADQIGGEYFWPKGWYGSDDEEFKYPTKWQPLPQPPKTEEG